MCIVMHITIQLRRRTALPSELAPSTLSSASGAGGDGDGLSVSKGAQMFREKAKQFSDTASATNTLVEG